MKTVNVVNVDTLVDDPSEDLRSGLDPPGHTWCVKAPHLSENIGLVGECHVVQ